MRDAATMVILLGTPATGRRALSAALDGRCALAEATVVVAGMVDGDRLVAELAAIRGSRPDDRLLLILEDSRNPPSAVGGLADAMVRIHPRFGGRSSDIALARRRVEEALTRMGIAAPRRRSAGPPPGGPSIPSAAPGPPHRNGRRRAGAGEPDQAASR